RRRPPPPSLPLPPPLPLLLRPQPPATRPSPLRAPLNHPRRLRGLARARHRPRGPRRPPLLARAVLRPRPSPVETTARSPSFASRRATPSSTTASPSGLPLSSTAPCPSES